MEELSFYRGWALLTAQPYATFITFDEHKSKLQEEMFKRAFIGFEDAAWMQVITRWIMSETEWPKIPELLSMLKANTPRPMALPVPIADKGGLAPIDYPPRQAYEHAKHYNITITEACRKLMPIWLRDNPNHPERERVEALLAVMQEKPKPRRLSMPTMDEVERHEFVTDLQADGCLAVCPKCKEVQREVLVCWCEQEVCRACLGVHMSQCDIGKIVNGV